MSILAIFGRLRRCLRYSPVHFAAMRIYRRSYLRYLELERRLFLDVFGSTISPRFAFDIGANRGDKTHVLSSLGIRVVAIDPDPFNIENLRSRFSHQPLVTVEALAVSAQPGSATFYCNEPGSPYNTLSVKWTKEMATRTGTYVGFTQQYDIPTQTLDNLILKHGRPEFIKIDVEGHELEVLLGLSTPVDLISFEVNLPVFRAEAIATIAHYAKVCPDVMINWSNNERLMWLEWRTPADACSFIDQTNLRYMEIYMRWHH